MLTIANTVKFAIRCILSHILFVVCIKITVFLVGQLPGKPFIVYAWLHVLLRGLWYCQNLYERSQRKSVTWEDFASLDKRARKLEKESAANIEKLKELKEKVAELRSWVMVDKIASELGILDDLGMDDKAKISQSNELSAHQVIETFHR
ncbi:uncharacterized protein BDR25DRAFT_318738 [Lindgomyces ingoldianus]|uniref:Uncharacterized protein n=1 Tax=Lindgomyces ingoldianus TaxID=673940 RepID=A0ACB6QFX7_9PLEO|nr:uncharacterized protein BDR25DRAFT_318738 [Lindgomyces ingoldianus]KAF2465022.1 hypothetical protein BDR25DRAFT_318738 [Lindgomyces ingoldianus]